MSHRSRNNAFNEFRCEKFITKMLRHEKNFATKKSPVPPPVQDKVSNMLRQSQLLNIPRVNKPKVNVIKPAGPPSPPKMSPVMVERRERGDELGSLVESQRSGKSQIRSKSRPRSASRDRESWEQLLRQNRSRDRRSNFSNFDPLRTVHFLSKELQSKLQNTLPDNDEIHQMVTDIQYALKRIPPEISTLLHNQVCDLPALIKVYETEKTNRPLMTNKNCQTPPTLYQEDTEKFQKIMEENTYRLEASCKQLEVVCTNLQAEKEMTERELDEAREHVEILCKKVKELENEIEQASNLKIQQLESEKQELQKELDKALEEIKNSPAISSLRQLVDDLQNQKASADKICTQLEYDVTLLKLEKEKFATMLALRDREIKEIQDEMMKLQDQVTRQLSKLNSEVVSKVNSMKSGSDLFLGLQDNRDLLLDFGDVTVSSIATDESEKDLNMMKKSPCGDAKALVTRPTQQQQDEFLKRFAEIQSSKVEFDLPTSKSSEAMLEEMLKGMTPSCKALLNVAL